MVGVIKLSNLTTTQTIIKIVVHVKKVQASQSYYLVPQFLPVKMTLSLDLQQLYKMP